MVLIAGDKHIYGDAVFAGEDFLKVFPFPLLEGDAATALSTTRNQIPGRIFLLSAVWHFQKFP